MERPTCKTCPYWQDLGEPDPTWADGNLGECLRFPPVLVTTQVRPRGGRPNGETFTTWNWPETGWWTGCGEHPDFAQYRMDRETGGGG